MAAPGILTGSDSLSIFRETGTHTAALPNTGVFGQTPGATPKYARNANNSGHERDAEYRDTMARLFIQVPPGQLNAFLATVSPATRSLARVLAVGGDSAGSGGTGFIDFVLTDSNEALQEKAQIVDTLTDNYVAFYAGQAPPVFRYSGMLLNTYQDDQRVWMLRLYEEILRGSRLANRAFIARLRYDSFIISGYMEDLSMGLSGATDMAGSFSFSLRVKTINVFTPSLGAPTVVETPATSGTILEGGPDTSTDARAGTVSPDSPTTPSSVPGASPAITQAQQTRDTLRAAGLTDAAIDSVLSASALAQGLGAQAQAAEIAHAATAQGLNRMSSSSGNTSNVSNDGQNGLSNVYGNQLPTALSQNPDGNGEIIEPVGRISSPRGRF